MKPLPLPELADLIKEEIRKSPYDVKTVFKKVGIPSTYLSRWKRNEVRPPSYMEITYLANILEKPVEYLIYGKLLEPPEKFTAHIRKQDAKMWKKKYEELLHEIQELTDRKLKQAYEI